MCVPIKIRTEQSVPSEQIWHRCCFYRSPTKRFAEFCCCLGSRLQFICYPKGRDSVQGVCKCEVCKCEVYNPHRRRHQHVWQPEHAPHEPLGNVEDRPRQYVRIPARPESQDVSISRKCPRAWIYTSNTTSTVDRSLAERWLACRVITMTSLALDPFSMTSRSLNHKERLSMRRSQRTCDIPGSTGSKA